MTIRWNLTKRPLAYIIVLVSFVFLTLHILSSVNQLSDGSVKVVRNKSNYLPAEQKRPYNLVGLDDETNLKYRIEDLKRIKISLSNELRLLERDKVRILKEKNSLIGRNEKLLGQISKSKIQLRQLDLDISSNRKQKFEKNCQQDRIAPIAFKPLKSVHIGDLSASNHIETISDSFSASPDKTFDYSLCAITDDFHFTIKNLSDTIQPDSNVSIEARIEPYIIQDLLRSHPQVSNTKQDVCLTVILTLSGKSLDFMQGNILMIDLSVQELDNDPPPFSNFMKASSCFKKGTFRDHVDVLVPSIWQHSDSFSSIIGSIPSHSPIERKYLALYFGSGNSSRVDDARDQLHKVLQTIHRNSIDDLFLFVYDCSPKTNEPCFESKERMIEMSIFTIIIPSEHYELDEYSNNMIYFALAKGSIPVIIGRYRIRLPFDEVIDWRRAALILPTSRLSELHFIIRSYSPADLYQMKYHGRRIFENYLVTSKQILDTILAVISLERFNYPPKAIQDFKSDTYYSERALKIDTNCSSSACQEIASDNMSSLLATEIYGPREKPFKSQAFMRNNSLALNNNYDLWNDPMYSSQHLFPSHPNDPIPPSEYKYLSPDEGFRPIGDGLGGSGSEFSRSLGGNHPNEQFTIVLLTYERKFLLMKTLERIRNLAYLNKIIVVWNGIQQGPSDDMVWANVGVPIVVVRPEKNSLNNRFLPYDLIETDAIFSMDDDSPLRPDEIIFAFRVWRQSRDRIVGFPGRYHAWDTNQNVWFYNSNHSCELSMVLTGGAFFHKYYSYAYTYFMPASVRSIVDKFMNCEDIAMNFLVAHLTRKPPIKVTSRWTFHCANCASSLSEDDSHFRERHECLNIFASIYGYMPLLNTQHRSDSILFKTRLPGDKQKCFKFV